MQHAVTRTTVVPALRRYVVDLLTATRASREIYLGASPRAGIAWLRAAKALAVLRGRDYVCPRTSKTWRSACFSTASSCPRCARARQGKAELSAAAADRAVPLTHAEADGTRHLFVPAARGRTSRPSAWTWNSTSCRSGFSAWRRCRGLWLAHDRRFASPHVGSEIAAAGDPLWFTFVLTSRSLLPGVQSPLPDAMGGLAA